MRIVHVVTGLGDGGAENTLLKWQMTGQQHSYLTERY